MELPPRTRRILNIFLNICTELGTTSAYAENTSHLHSSMCAMKNYLRVRGEYCLFVVEERLESELPPRTRRIQHLTRNDIHDIGTTSAYAENTTRLLTSFTIRGNYLRVRGEYPLHGLPCVGLSELPPRTRRILNEINRQFGGLGTTSAYAENTTRHALMRTSKWNYLRVRGEYSKPKPMSPKVRELPPRTRRILFNDDHAYHRLGTTSAYAENTCQVVVV